MRFAEPIFYAPVVLGICFAIGVASVMKGWLGIRRNEPCATCWHDAKNHKPAGLGRCLRCDCSAYDRPPRGDVELLREWDRGRSNQ